MYEPWAQRLQEPTNRSSGLNNELYQREDLEESCQFFGIRWLRNNARDFHGYIFTFHYYQHSIYLDGLILGLGEKGPSCNPARELRVRERRKRKYLSNSCVYSVAIQSIQIRLINNQEHRFQPATVMYLPAVFKLLRIIGLTIATWHDPEDRDAIQSVFNEEALTVSMTHAVGAIGLNLQQRCWRVHLFESTHNLGILAQVLGRAVRDGNLGT